MRPAGAGRRRWLPVAVLAVAAAGAALGAGCSREAEDRSAKAEVRLVTWKPNQPDLWEEVYRLFERRHPDRRLVREVGPHSSTAFHDMLTQKLKNQSRDVDVFLMDVIWPAEFAAAGWAEPLDERFPRSARDEFLPGAVLANTYEGRVYGIPLYAAAGVLYYRKDLLERHGFTAPPTWEELVRQAETISAAAAGRGEEIHGFSGQFKQYEGLVCDMLEFILGAGGHIVDPASGRSALAERPALEAVGFVRERLIGAVAPRGVLTYQEPESLDLFLQGKAVFHRNWPYAWNVASDPEKSRVAGKVGIAPVPHFPGGSSHGTLGGWQVGVSRFSARKDAAWRLAEFLTSREVQTLLARRGGLAPTRKAVYEDAEVLAAQPHLRPMKDVFLTARPRPRTPLYPALSHVLQRYFSSAVSDPSLDLEAAAREASAEVDRILAMGR